MKNFHKIADGVDVLPLMHAITLKPYLWNQNELRKHYPNSPHAQADDLWLRFNDLTQSNIQIANDRECINFPALRELPQARPIIFDLMRRVEGEQLGRVMITRLTPGKQIFPHEDAGAPAEFYSRYHVLLQSLPGALFHCGGETVNMQSGECWWFNNRLVHSVVNNSADDRITMIIDIRIDQ